MNKGAVMPNEEYNIKKICGLFGSRVCVSSYNDNGKCECFGCMGFKCQTCNKYKSLLSDYDLEKIKCENCMKVKTR